MKLFEIPIYLRSKKAACKDKWWRAYEYNETVGWVVLEGRQKVIRAEYFFVRERPSRMLVRKEFEPMGKLFQVPLNRQHGTYRRLHIALGECQENSFLSRFHFDLEAFEAVGPYLDWGAAGLATAHSHRLDAISGTLAHPSATRP